MKKDPAIPEWLLNPGSLGTHTNIFPEESLSFHVCKSTWLILENKGML